MSTLLLLATCVLSPSVFVFFFPQLHVIAPTVLIVGFGSLILFFWVFSFRRSKLGPFVLWTQPAKLFRIAFTERELLALRICACVGLGGGLAVGVLLVTA